MTREARTLFLGTLTLIVYSVSIFFSQGSFVFPFPLNEFIFLAIAIQFFVWNREGNKFVGTLSTLAGICGVLSTQFFWAFLYGPENMADFMKGLTTDYFLIAFYVLVLIGGIATIIQQKKGIAMLLSTFFIAFFLFGAILNSSLLLLVAYGFIATSTQMEKSFVPYHLLWILLFILELSKWLTFILNS